MRQRHLINYADQSSGQTKHLSVTALQYEVSFNQVWICFILIWGRCNLKRSWRTVIFLPVYKISSLKISLPKLYRLQVVQLKTLDFLQQTITMNENAQWQMIKDSVLFALSSGFSVSLFHFYLKKKSTRGQSDRLKAQQSLCCFNHADSK